MALELDRTTFGSLRRIVGSPDARSADVESKSLAGYCIVWSAIIVLFVAQKLMSQNAYRWEGDPPLLALCAAAGWLIRALIALPFFIWIQRYMFTGTTWKRRVLQ